MYMRLIVFASIIILTIGGCLVFRFIIKRMDETKVEEISKYYAGRIQHNLERFILEDEIRKDERRKVWDEINKHIKAGDLQGDGCNDLAQRNGLVMATNIIFQMGI